MKPSCFAKLAGATAVLLTSTLLAATTSAQQPEQGVKAGFLRCGVDASTSFIFGSTKEVDCTYTPEVGDRVDRYSGTISRYGVDIGFRRSGVILWGVIAPSNDVGEGALAGSYGGASAEIVAAYGVGVNALVGGFEKSLVLQPLSVEGLKGLSIALGITGLELKPK
jgi:hypothetical protein